MKLAISFFILQKNIRSSYAFLSENAEDMSMMPKVIKTMKYFNEVDELLKQVAKVRKISRMN